MTQDKDNDNNIVIFRYTRKQAIEDGVLVDVTKIAKEAGIKYPTAITSAVWNTFIVPTEEERKNGQSEDGRLWDTLWMFRDAAKKEPGDVLLFKLYFSFAGKPRLVTLKAICGPGDEGEPVITIMLPDED